MTNSLNGLRVLDMGRVFAAPWCTQLLGDLGADIIKVERIGRGDEFRHYGPPFVKDSEGVETELSAQFAATNRNKRSITADITKPGAQEIIRRLAAVCDIAVENFKVGDLKRYGLDYESLKRENADLIYCSITGFGQDGPYAERPAYDTVFQCMSGIMSVTGAVDGPPQKVGTIIFDLIAGLYAANAIQAAVRHREVSGGGGQYIDLAMIDVSVATMSQRAMEYLCGGHLPQRLGNGSLGSAPAQLFDCKEGYIDVQAGQDQDFRALCNVLGRPELKDDPRFTIRANRFRNRVALSAILEPIFLTRTSSEWYEILVAGKIVASPVYTMDQTFNDPQVLHRQIRRDLDHPKVGKLPFIANPIRMSETPIEVYRRPPDLGEHTDEVLTDLLGYSADEIAYLRSVGAI